MDVTVHLLNDVGELLIGTVESPEDGLQPRGRALVALGHPDELMGDIEFGLGTIKLVPDEFSLVGRSRRRPRSWGSREIRSSEAAFPSSTATVIGVLIRSA